jgi:hypothetical protein
VVERSALATRAIELRPWGDLVFHVLAHALETAPLAASLYDRTYVEFAARLLGPAGDRSLGEDAQVLGKVLGSHELLARVQLVARLFDSIEGASQHAAVDLGVLAERGVVRAELVRSLEPVIHAAELLRVTCEIEREPFAKLPATSFAGSELAQALDALSSLAPLLGSCTVAAVRSLRLRGRAFPDEIWFGVPSAELGVSVDHAAWQACHEATVLELSLASTEGAGEREIEHAAVVLLAERARSVEKESEHGRWLLHFGPHAPPLDRDRLPAAARELVERCYSAPAASATWRSRT